jgi:hypothetical protein
MNVASIILDLRSELAGIEQAINSASRWDRLLSRTKEGLPRSQTGTGRTRRPQRTISELRTDRHHLKHAVLSLAVFDRLRRRN